MTEDERAQKLWEGWKRYHKDNPEIWEWFVKFAFVKINRNRRNYSADAVMHAVRFDLDLHPVTAEEYKVSNYFVAFYARLFAQEYPEHASLFQYRYSLADRFFGDL